MLVQGPYPLQDDIVIGDESVIEGWSIRDQYCDGCKESVIPICV